MPLSDNLETEKFKHLRLELTLPSQREKKGEDTTTKASLCEMVPITRKLNMDVLPESSGTSVSSTMSPKVALLV